MDEQHAHRKDEHVFIAEKQYCQVAANGLEQVRLLPNNLPEISAAEIDLSTQLAGLKVETPFFINAMSGGSKQTARINQKLAAAAAQTGLAMATGSQSIALNSPAAAASFQTVRQELPQGIVIGNLGAGHGLHDAKQAVKMLNADLLELHLNAVQEIIMPEGDTEFFWSRNIREVVQQLAVPVIVKEVGFGISPQTLKKLKTLGVHYVDLSGRGGTNFAQIENQRLHEMDFSVLNDFGLTTAETLVASQPFQADFSFTASGGIRTSLDIVKCLVLGADNVGIAGLFLHTVLKEDIAGLVTLINTLKQQIRAIMTVLGCHNIKELRQVPYVLAPDLLSFKEQLK
ncbi:type 2 isopentenyl-diphosphate Delta-isomerase [Liquorilactobacillus satsumensis]|uniref:Isopentenyl-diphosphate delta-isomerase n=1 Tax=Liquorilactobacillus satsumensis DSM 16230 = JCM 12392 TaxID=1423801 RepID=A0A0R1UXL1_9LACO|nr:type 2 isopentenyl-diphosphate Delta-isomerase [Liquorilactobacillus satsumensis]KRL98009.1 isopentenyl pyrophosphate isomerase [Liquorilactobacillus satsumensis DSM 16230 = JCM 12392]MCP9312326.1 type 2 isopentenyl-diphosphate Delta-isomerase [Liquorilactobacillus satsumensis]MCP9327699.1 type 2 isopentenyl-diphosphate Delta-isomerase [Liquorilactobacillus satsumensis]MCP9359670.1 type 2 isopentenyl-diphosphate Delta-isomerase [Liquorilactobacillus satsumensis]